MKKTLSYNQRNMVHINVLEFAFANIYILLILINVPALINIHPLPLLQKISYIDFHQFLFAAFLDKVA